MSNRNEPRSGSLAVRVLAFLVVLAGLAAVMYFTIPDNQAGPGTEKTKTQKVDDHAHRCDDQLADLIEAMNPGRLGISSDRSQIADRLNAWAEECGKIAGDARPSSDSALLQKMLQGESLSQAMSERYLAEDTHHIRMSLLARDVVAGVVEGNPSQLDRIVKLFDFTCRNVMLINSAIRDEMDATAYESLVFGLGTDADRAWIFANLLRQLRTDAVILTPRAEGKTDEWLIGVIDPQHGIYLFDPRLGLPIPAAGSPTDTPYPQLPATLQAVRESDEAFRQLDVPDSPYPLNSELMHDLNVSLIGTSSTWAPRMANLQFLLPQTVSVDLYDGLGANELRTPGLLERVVSAGKDGLWKEENVQVWPLPELAEQKFEKTHGEGAPNSQLANFLFVFKGPYVPRQTGADGKTFQPTPIEKSLHLVRIEQLQGKYGAAIRDFLPVRTTVKNFASPANQSAAEFGTLWTGVSQFKTQHIRTALGTLDRYVTTQVQSTGMARSGVEYLADCMLAQKNYKLAADILLKVPEGFAPRRDQYLIRRWQKLAGIDPDHANAPKAPAEPKKDEAKPEMKAPAAPADGSAGQAPVTKMKGPVEPVKPGEADDQSLPEPPVPVEVMPARDETLPAPAKTKADQEPAKETSAEPAAETSTEKKSDSPEPAEESPAPASKE